MNIPTVSYGIHRAIDKALGNTKPSIVRRAGDDLHTAFARRLGIPTLPDKPYDPDAVRVKPNRRAKRAAGNPGLYRWGSYYRPAVSGSTKPRLCPSRELYDTNNASLSKENAL